MKTNFKKTLAVLMVVLMLSSMFSILASAADPYTITYKPGSGNVVGEEVSFTYTSNTTKFQDALFTREHYTQTGWATEDGGDVKYKFGATYRGKKDLVLYPAWTGDVYTLTYAPGQYATGGSLKTVSVNYGASVGLETVLFTREGYVQSGWSLVDGGEKVYDLGSMSNLVSEDFTLYPYWTQVYVVEYVAGQYGVGTGASENVEGGKTFTTKGKLFTRPDYTQVGWSTEDGGDMVYGLNQNHVVATSNMTLYPYWLLNTYGLVADNESIYFGDFCDGYIAPEAKTFKITNKSNVSITLSATECTYFDVSFTGSKELSAGESIVVSATPKEGLPFDRYVENIVFTIVEYPEYTVSVELTFAVSDHVYGKYESNNDATYSSDGTMSAYCVKGCGDKHTIEDLGSKKVYSADNNDAVGLASSYIHHRTVRFTAYGSGMDDTEGVVGKRFVPVSWYVNDEFNGTFEEGYDVKFTHTVFGKYTLTINYVEEQLDEATGEWLPTGEVDEKVFEYTVGTTAEEEQEIVRPNTILSIIFGLFAKLFELLGL